MPLRLTLLVLFLVIPNMGYSTDSRHEIAIDLLYSAKIIGRDSGEEVSRDFIGGCIKAVSSSHLILQCDDVLFTHYISFYERSGKSEIVLVTEDGASVENRWVFAGHSGEFKDITSYAWPKISKTTIGKLLREKTGDEKYSEEYVASVAHSSYRVQYSPTGSIDVASGMPDKSWGVKIGEIQWNGEVFQFVPNPS